MGAVDGVAFFRPIVSDPSRRFGLLALVPAALGSAAAALADSPQPFHRAGARLKRPVRSRLWAATITQPRDSPTLASAAALDTGLVSILPQS